MSDDSSAQTSGGSLPIIVPADVRARFGTLIDFIIASESMTDDERRYWIDILPAMSDEQIASLKDILVRERDQLAAIDTKYAQDITKLADAQAVQATGEVRKLRNQERSSSEAHVREDEEKAAEGLLSDIQQLKDS